MKITTNSGVRPNPELLAPAGSPACALAAFEAGADAIYAGLARFNARERGENFTPERMSQIIAHAHRLGRKVYLTLNTLVKESELPEVAETARDARGDGARCAAGPGPRHHPHGARIFPEARAACLDPDGIPQLGRTRSRRTARRNPGRARAADDARRRSRRSAKSTKLELEVFVHGALAASLSGACLFSSYLGGYSGNRGKCKQPCRRRYFGKGGNGFFFSPQDLCAIELLPRLRELGIESLKIEGRLKQPDYVKQTVGAYRMLLDAPPDDLRNVSERRATCFRRGAAANGRSASTQRSPATPCFA